MEIYPASAQRGHQSVPQSESTPVDSSVLQEDAEKAKAIDPGAQFEAMPVIRGRLRADHLEHLRASAISDDVLVERGYRTVTSKQEVQQLGAQLGARQIRVPGLVFPVYRLGASEVYTWVLRPDSPRSRSEGQKQRFIKYEWPQLVSPCLDILPRYRALLADPSIPIVITEGAKKADALTSADTSVVPININGVWGFRGTNEHGGKLILPEMEEIAWNGRIIELMFDSDVVRKRQVLLALERLGAVLAARGAAVRVLVLPQDDDTKMGVDDALAQGRTMEWIRSHLIPLREALALGREKLFKHLETGREIFLPAGYIVSNERIARDMKGTVIPLYSGIIAVTETGEDLATREETLTVSFLTRGEERRSVTAPRADLGRGAGVINHLGARGASVHEGNARDVARFLIEFAHENRDALPHRPHIARLGLVSEGLVTPAGSVGFAFDVDYRGEPLGAVSTNLEPYRTAVRAALLWEDPWSLWLALGFSLASPAIARLRPRRNPVLYFAGPSNSGKTTVTQFGTGVWGDPTKRPLRIQAGRTTRVGYLQRIEGLGGLPLFVDEAHAANNPSELEALVYDFANGQTYTKGGKDGHARGGEVLSGVLMLVGEAMLMFRHTGAHRRVLWVNGAQWPPMGAEPQSAAGQERATMLEDAWLNGAGALGIHVARAMWADWPHFQEAMQRLQGHEALQKLGTWQQPLAAAAAAFYVALQLLDLRPPSHFSVLLPMWAEMLAGGQEQTNPAAEAWEQVALLIAQAQIVGVDKWTIAYLHDEPVAYWQHKDDYWRIPTGTKQFKDRVGDRAAQLYGQTWLLNEWIRPGPGGSATTNKSIYRGGEPKCLMVRIDALAHRPDPREE